MAIDIVVEGTDEEPVFTGRTEDVVAFLEDHPSDRPRKIYIGAITGVLSESEYLDLAT